VVWVVDRVGTYESEDLKCRFLEAIDAGCDVLTQNVDCEEHRMKVDAVFHLLAARRRMGLDGQRR
jgi:nucleoside-diphosphate-sugar epimerase